MAFSPPLALSDAAKLEALRRSDQFREWHSLDDKRFCLVCGKIITGREIQVASATGGNGLEGLKCPTERCNSIPMDWVLPTDEILAVAETTKSEQQRKVAPESKADHDTGHGLTSHLKKLAVDFKLVF